MRNSARKRMAETLEDEAVMAQMIRMAVDKMSFGRDARSESFDELVTTIFQNNSKLVHEHCESPIERQLFNSLQMAAITQGTFIFVRPPAYDYFAATQKECDQTASLFQCHDFYKNLPDNARPDSFRDFLSAFDDLETDEVDKMDSRFMVDCDLGFSHFPNLVLQQPLSGIFSGGVVRPDAILFVPTNPSVSIVIECDGHEFHGSKDAFIADRQRDRKFIDKGFTVRRYSGSEIYQDPAGTAMDLLGCIGDGQCGSGWKGKWEAGLRLSNNKPRPEVIAKWVDRKAASFSGVNA